ncbi:MAG: type III-B CRISPR module RAMP protein Cmr6 [Chloroflexota bacterium]
MQHDRRSRGPGPGTPPPPYPLPRATVDALGQHSKQNQLCVGANRSLALNKLVGPWAALDSTKPTLDADSRRRFLEALCPEPKEAQEVHQLMLKRWQAQVESYGRSGWTVRELRAQPEWRFISGLGMANPLETNLVLHRIGGFPYIPGSSMKGAVRAYAELALGVTPRRPQTAATDFSAEERDLLEVFGAQDQAGKVIFFDALPVTCAALELDVINVHYPQYYQQGQPPADWQNPVPVLFLAVGKKTQFTFAVASRHVRLAELALQWLQGALQTTGLGGKTSAGYGYFQLPPASTRQSPAHGQGGRPR